MESKVVKSFFVRQEGIEPEIHRFAIPGDITSCYSSIRNKVANIYSLNDTHFNMYWQDSDGDLVIFSSQEELAEAVNCATDPVIKIIIKRAHAVANIGRVASPGVVHHLGELVENKAGRLSVRTSKREEDEPVNETPSSKGKLAYGRRWRQIQGGRVNFNPRAVKAGSNSNVHRKNSEAAVDEACTCKKIRRGDWRRFCRAGTNSVGDQKGLWNQSRHRRFHQGLDHPTGIEERALFYPGWKRVTRDLDQQTGPSHRFQSRERTLISPFKFPRMGMKNDYKWTSNSMSRVTPECQIHDTPWKRRLQVYPSATLHSHNNFDSCQRRRARCFRRRTMAAEENNALFDDLQARRRNSRMMAISKPPDTDARRCSGWPSQQHVHVRNKRMPRAGKSEVAKKLHCPTYAKFARRSDSLLKNLHGKRNITRLSQHQGSPTRHGLGYDEASNGGIESPLCPVHCIPGLRAGRWKLANLMRSKVLQTSPCQRKAFALKQLALKRQRNKRFRQVSSSEKRRYSCRPICKSLGYGHWLTDNLRQSQNYTKPKLDPPTEPKMILRKILLDEINRDTNLRQRCHHLHLRRPFMKMRTGRHGNARNWNAWKTQGYRRRFML